MRDPSLADERALDAPLWKTTTLNVVGISPLIIRRYIETCDRKFVQLRHEPLADFRESMYYLRELNSPTVLAIRPNQFKHSIVGAAREVRGRSTKIGRCMWAIGESVPLYGVPRVLTMMLRSKLLAPAPSIRASAIFAEWACRIPFMFVETEEETLVQLATVAGLTIGIGTWRPQTGHGAYGRFRLVSETDADFVRICERGGRKAQLEALEYPVAYEKTTQGERQ